MSRTKKLISVGTLAALALIAMVGAWTWPAFISPPSTYHVKGFRFHGPSALENAASTRHQWPGAVGREDPTFVVGPLTDQGVSILLRAEHSETTVSGHAALLQESEVFAPGHGGRDHDISVYVPELGAGINVHFRTHEKDHDAGLLEHFDGWRCRRWARTVISSLEWDPEE
jgi:hypothetical protein